MTIESHHLHCSIFLASYLGKKIFALALLLREGVCITGVEHGRVHGFVFFIWSSGEARHLGMGMVYLLGWLYIPWVWMEQIRERWRSEPAAYGCVLTV